MDLSIAFPTGGKAFQSAATQQAPQAGHRAHPQPRASARSGIGFNTISVAGERPTNLQVRQEALGAEGEAEAYYCRSRPLSTSELLQSTPTLADLVAEGETVSLALVKKPIQLGPYVDLSTEPRLVAFDLLQTLNSRLTYRVHVWIYKYTLEVLGGNDEVLLTAVRQVLGLDSTVGWEGMTYRSLLEVLDPSEFPDGDKENEQVHVGSQEHAGSSAAASHSASMLSEMELEATYRQLLCFVMGTNLACLQRDWVVAVVRLAELGTIALASPKGQGALLHLAVMRAGVYEVDDEARIAWNVAAHPHSMLIDTRMGHFGHYTQVKDDLAIRFGDQQPASGLVMEPAASRECDNLTACNIRLRKQVILDMVGHAEKYMNSYIGDGDGRVLQVAALPFLGVYKCLEEQAVKKKRKNKYKEERAHKRR